MSEKVALKKKKEKKSEKEESAIEIKDAWFRYEKDSPDVVKDLTLQIRKGEFYALVGGNGTGKSTTLIFAEQESVSLTEDSIYLEGKGSSYIQRQRAL